MLPAIGRIALLEMSHARIVSWGLRVEREVRIDSCLETIIDDTRFMFPKLDSVNLRRGGKVPQLR